MPILSGAVANREEIRRNTQKHPSNTQKYAETPYQYAEIRRNTLSIRRNTQAKTPPRQNTPSKNPTGSGVVNRPYCREEGSGQFRWRCKNPKVPAELI